MKLYPLKFKPILKEKLWGGTKLKDVLNKPSESEITGESWELSGVDGDVSKVANGDLEGVSLKQLIQQNGKDLLGERALNRFGDDFPILIKFIDAKQDLSIQLHPDDELAKARHNSFGKTEMWYVMNSDPDGKLIVGFNRDVAKDQYIKSLKEDTLLDLMNYEYVSQGDTFFINTGKVHAICAGVMLAEIQQTSDLTYRIFDFNRKDKDGNLRELHTDLALDAIDYEKKDDFKVNYSKASDVVNEMVDCPYFKTNFLDLTTTMHQDITDRDSFTIYMCVEGEAKIKNDWGTISLVSGETILIAAASTSINITTTGAKLLEVTI